MDWIGTRSKHMIKHHTYRPAMFRLSHVWPEWMKLLKLMDCLFVAFLKTYHLTYWLDGQHLCSLMFPNIIAIAFQRPFFPNMSVTVLDWPPGISLSGTLQWDIFCSDSSTRFGISSSGALLVCWKHWKRGFCASNPCSHIDQGVHVVVAAAHASDDGGHLQAGFMPAICKETQGGKAKWIDYVYSRTVLSGLVKSVWGI